MDFYRKKQQIATISGSILTRRSYSYPQDGKKIDLDTERRGLSNCAFIFRIKSRA